MTPKTKSCKQASKLKLDSGGQEKKLCVVHTDRNRKKEKQSTEQLDDLGKILPPLPPSPSPLQSVRALADPRQSPKGEGGEEDARMKELSTAAEVACTTTNGGMQNGSSVGI